MSIHSKSFALPEITRITPPRLAAGFAWRELWRARELLYFLIWRDLKVRYRQTILGPAWAIIQPVVTMVVFSFVFGRLAQLPSDGVPYPLFVFAGLLPWQFFSGAFGRVIGSVVSSSGLITKVYFPRLVSPLATVLTGIVDFAIAFLILLGLMAYYQAPLSPRILLVPFLLFLAMATALSLGLWLAALNVRFRDIGFMAPFLVQIWLYLSPVAYSTTIVPAHLQTLYNLNPMTLVVGGFRWALLDVPMTLQWTHYLALTFVVLGLVGGVLFFHQRAQTFADVI